MNERGFWRLEEVSDGHLQAALHELLTKGARTEARIVAHLAEVDARKLHLTVGASSLFDYCLTRLGLSNNEAFHRITAARLARRFPVIFEMLERRDVHLTAVCLLRDYLTPENHAELLREVSHKTKVQIEQLLARRFPTADSPNRLRKLPAFEPRSEGRYLLQLNASEALKHKLELARDLMSHAIPSGDLAVVVERALDTLLEKLQARRFAQTKRQRTHSETPGEAEARPIGPAAQPAATKFPAAQPVAERPPAQVTAPDNHATARRAHLRHDVRRAVVARDGQRCAFLSQDGHRCDARAFLQFHHERAWALGGPDTPENLKLLCRAHNQLLAEREFGEARVANAIARTRK